MVDFTLSEEQAALREKARNFALNKVLPVASKYDKTGEFPGSVIEKAHKEGSVFMLAMMTFVHTRPAIGAMATVLVKQWNTLLTMLSNGEPLNVKSQVFRLSNT